MMETQNQILFKKYHQELTQHIVFESSREVEQELIDELRQINQDRQKYLVYNEQYKFWERDKKFQNEYNKLDNKSDLLYSELSKNYRGDFLTDFKKIENYLEENAIKLRPKKRVMNVFMHLYDVFHQEILSCFKQDMWHRKFIFSENTDSFLLSYNIKLGYVQEVLVEAGEKLKGKFEHLLSLTHQEIRDLNIQIIKTTKPCGGTCSDGNELCQLFIYARNSVAYKINVLSDEEMEITMIVKVDKTNTPYVSPSLANERFLYRYQKHIGWSEIYQKYEQENQLEDSHLQNITQLIKNLKLQKASLKERRRVVNLYIRLLEFQYQELPVYHATRASTQKLEFYRSIHDKDLNYIFYQAKLEANPEDLKILESSLRKILDKLIVLKHADVQKLHREHTKSTQTSEQLEKILCQMQWYAKNPMAYQLDFLGENKLRFELTFKVDV